MNFFNSAWNSIDANAVINCFNKSGFCRKLFNSAVVEDTDESVTISKEWQQIAGTNATFSDYVDCDSSLFAFQQSSLKEILGQHQADANQEDNDDDGDKEQEALPIPTLTAAFEAMDTVRHYVCSFNVDEKVINQTKQQYEKSTVTQTTASSANFDNLTDSTRALVHLAASSTRNGHPSMSAQGSIRPRTMPADAEITIWPTVCGYCLRPTRDFWPPAPGQVTPTRTSTVGDAKLEAGDCFCGCCSVFLILSLVFLPFCSLSNKQLTSCDCMNPCNADERYTIIVV
ncbi:hypothetical protein T01_14285 [Trichinella spiralis]|uniref:Uncharacterized protein n=1 Tax=Trichinella spiralis TaxID=6334 RepID=A0A0V1B2M2_TRISP|nr:hypothetical protein T01_14285 [Trichinella spiralis]